MTPLRRLVAIVLVVVAAVVAPATFPSPATAESFVVPPLARVVDQANVLSPATREQLDRLLAEHEKRGSNQVVVVTLGSLGGLDIAEAGLRLGRAWRLGTRQHSNGALLVVAPAERKVRIEVGYGLEGNLPDARAFQIIDREILPRFRAGDLEGGILKGALAIVASIEGSYQPPKAAGGLDGGDLAPLILVIVLALVVVVAIYRNGGFGGGSGGRGPWGSSPYGRRHGSWGRGPMIVLPGGSWGGGGRGGGGFSGGGGSFGGGGATGSW